MSNTVISVEKLSKAYRLGQIGTGTLTYDMKLWWAKLRGKPNPLLRIGETDHGNREGETLWALKDVSFTVEQGEVLGIIGRNGAGKSTLLKILSRVTAPTSGRIRLKGRVASLLEVGTGFHPDLTGRENIYLNGAILGMNRREIDRKFDEIVDFAEVEKFIDTPVKRYSSGMYVRLAFAVAAHLEPEILVVDEVLAVGDAEFQKKCLGKMGDVAKQGRTVLFVSHNMDAIQRLCSKVIYLDTGCILQSGNTLSIVEQYLQKSFGNSQSLVAKFDIDTSKKIAFKEVRLLYNGENKIGCEIDYQVLSQSVNAVIALRINANTGVPVITITDNDLDQERFNKKKGSYMASCNLPTQLLAPGNYRLTVSAADMKGVRYDYYEGILSFTLTQSPIIKPSFTREGVLLVPTPWEITEG